MARDGPRSGDRDKKWKEQLTCSFSEIKLFATQLSVLFNAGVPLLDSFSVLSRQTDNPALTEVYWSIQKRLLEGHRLSSAMSEYPRIFGAEFIKLMRVAETTGRLAYVLESLASTLDRRDTIMRKVWSAVSYPLVLFAITGLALVLFTAFVVPTLEPLLTVPGFEVPLPTRFMLLLSSLVRDPWPLLLTAALLGMAWGSRQRAFEWYRSQPQRAVRLARICLGTPYLGVFLRRLAMTRALDTLAMTLEAGVPLLEAITAAGEVSGNAAVAYRLRMAAAAIREGETFGDALGSSESTIIPSEAAAMITVGEEAGQLPLMCRTLANMYREAVQHDLVRLTSLLEPILMAVLGLLTLVVALSTALPTIQLMQIL